MNVARDSVLSTPLRTALLVFTLSLASPACSQLPTGSGYLGSYIDMQPNRYLEAESHLPWLRIDRETPLVIQPVQPYFYRGRRPGGFPRLASAFQAALAREIGKTNLFAGVREGNRLMIPPDTGWTLTAVITEVETGLAESSLEPGVTYHGARRISVEGKISQVRGDRLLLKFKDARVGMPRRGLPLTEADVESGLVRDLEAIARGVADTLREIYAESRQVPAAPATRVPGDRASVPAVEGEGDHPGAPGD